MFGRFVEWLVCAVLARHFPGRYRVIPRMPDGVPLLRQFRLFSFGKEAPRGTPPWYHVSCFLQSFVAPENYEHFHLHRWRYMLSFVLTGEFVEERLGGMLLKHTAPSVYSMSDDVIHRLAYVESHTWTLFFMLGKNQHQVSGGWGYFARPKMHYSAWNAAIPETTRVKAIT